jgi:hypothetical protein
MENKIDGIIMLAWSFAYVFQMIRLGHPKITNWYEVPIALLILVSLSHGVALLFR